MIIKHSELYPDTITYGSLTTRIEEYTDFGGVTRNRGVPTMVISLEDENGRILDVNRFTDGDTVIYRNEEYSITGYIANEISLTMELQRAQ